MHIYWNLYLALSLASSLCSADEIKSNGLSRRLLLPFTTDMEVDSMNTGALATTESINNGALEAQGLSNDAISSSTDKIALNDLNAEASAAGLTIPTLHRRGMGSNVGAMFQKAQKAWSRRPGTGPRLLRQNAMPKSRDFHEVPEPQGYNPRLPLPYAPYPAAFQRFNTPPARQLQRARNFQGLRHPDGIPTDSMHYASPAGQLHHEQIFQNTQSHADNMYPSPRQLNRQPNIASYRHPNGIPVSHWARKRSAHHDIEDSTREEAQSEEMGSIRAANHPKALLARGVQGSPSERPSRVQKSNPTQQVITQQDIIRFIAKTPRKNTFSNGDRRPLWVKLPRSSATYLTDDVYGGTVIIIASKEYIFLAHYPEIPNAHSDHDQFRKLKETVIEPLEYELFHSKLRGAEDVMAVVMVPCMKGDEPETARYPNQASMIREVIANNIDNVSDIVQVVFYKPDRPPAPAVTSGYVVVRWDTKAVEKDVSGSRITIYDNLRIVANKFWPDWPPARGCCFGSSSVSQ